MPSVLEWTRSRTFSSLATYHLPDTHARPNDATRVGNSWIPRAPDGFTTGNTMMFAAVGVPCIDAEQVYSFYSGDMDQPLVQRVDHGVLNLLVGPDKATVHLQHGLTVFKVQGVSVASTCHGARSRFEPGRAPFSDARRVRGTGIISTRARGDRLQLTTIDFCPRGPDEPVLHRLVSTWNAGPDVLSAVVLSVELENRAGSWTCRNGENGTVIITEAKGDATFHVMVTGAGSTVVARAFEERPGRPADRDTGTVPDELDGTGFLSIDVSLGDLEPGEECIVLVSLVPVANGATVLATPSVPGAFESLERTARAWRELAGFSFASDDRLLEDVVDAMITLGLSHAGTRGIHTGAVYYTHGRAWTRDNYWIQEAFHHAGIHDVPARDVAFFLDAWRANGETFANSYGMPSMSPSNPDCEVLVELPSYHVLMLASLLKWAPRRKGDIDPAVARRLVIAVLDAVDASRNGLFPLNSDETWIWACDVAETGVVLDNSTLTLASLLAIQDWLGDFLDGDTVNRVEATIERVEHAARAAFPIPGKHRLAVARDDDGIQDETAMTIPLAMPFIHDLVARRPWLRDLAFNGLVACWHACKHPVDGGGFIVRSHSATTAITGNTPGHFLEALAAAGARETGDVVLEGILHFLNCTGSVNEIHDAFDPSWGTERRRLWDTMATLQGILQHVLGSTVRPGQVSFTPRCPARAGTVAINGVEVRGHAYSFRMKREHGEHFCAVKRDGAEIARFKGLKTILIDEIPDGISKISTVDAIDDTSRAFRERTGGHPFWTRGVQHVNGTGDGTTCAIIHDRDSKAHATTIQANLLFTRLARVPVLQDHDWERAARDNDILAWTSRDVPGPFLNRLAFPEVVQDMARTGYTIMPVRVAGRERLACWIPNKGHAYRDTNRFIQDLRLHVMPTRGKPMSAHPHGILRFSDWAGSPITEKIPANIELEASDVPGDARVPVFIQGVHVHDLGPGSMRWQGTVPTTVKGRGIERVPTYLLVNCITPFAPFDLAAAGIADGRHAVRVTVQSDATVPLHVTITLALPQSWHPQNLRSPRWDRLEEPVTVHRLANGEKEFTMHVTPGPRSHGSKGNGGNRSTARHLTFTFIKYP